MASYVSPSFRQYWTFPDRWTSTLHTQMGYGKPWYVETLHAFELKIYLCATRTCWLWRKSRRHGARLTFAWSTVATQLMLHVSGPIRTIHATLGHYPIRHIPERLLHWLHSRMEIPAITTYWYVLSDVLGENWKTYFCHENEKVISSRATLVYVHRLFDRL